MAWAGLGLGVLLALGGTMVAQAATPASVLEVRFCPERQLYAHPADVVHGVGSVLLQNVLVRNTGPSAVDLSAVEIALQRGGREIEKRTIAGEDLEAAGRTGGALQAQGYLELLAFQFCGGRLVPKGTRLAGAHLEPGQALILMGQPFEYRGERDRVSVTARATSAMGAVEGTDSLPIRHAFAKAHLRFPLQGAWYVAVGPSLHTPHRWALPEEFGFDVVRLREDGRTHEGNGTAFTDYSAYGQPVLAGADGVVVAAASDVAEDPSTLRQPGETDDAYGMRVATHQMQLLQGGTRAVTGNYVVLDHGGSEYSVYAHLRPGTVGVTVGQRVHAGERLGELGSSGNSTEPHLHFQVCDGPDPLNCVGIPVAFVGIQLPLADSPRPLMSGEVVLAP
jgi:murein DD-endopeptidase MepM/ murein hydrolase activator NlpD